MYPEWTRPNWSATADSNRGLPVIGRMSSIGREAENGWPTTEGWLPLEVSRLRLLVQSQAPCFWTKGQWGEPRDLNSPFGGHNPACFR